jgi:chitin disaccharide deacetylase
MSATTQLMEKISAPTGSSQAPGDALQHGALIVNADDWGCDTATTDRTLDCFGAGAVSSVSAMVFMADSERAAETARHHSIDAGLHLNFTTPYSARHCRPQLKEHQQKIARSLTANRYAGALFLPKLSSSFEYVVTAQLEEYERLYGAFPTRLDGHHHMHLCANVQRQALLPPGSIVRRNLTFQSGEKSFLNRLYRRMQDRRLARRHHLADYFFNLHPVVPRARLMRIFEMGIRFIVEIETHSLREEEYRFLVNGEIQRCAGDVRIAKGYVLRTHSSNYSEEKLA